jgi:hypothetical protein
MLTAVLAATLLSGLVSFAAIVTSYAVRITLASSPATSILITSSAGPEAAAAQDSTRVAAVLHRALPGGPLHIEGSLGTDYLNIPAGQAGQHAQTHIISLADPSRRAVLTAGTWPPQATGGGAGTALPVAVPAATASKLRLHPGSTLALQVATTGRRIGVRGHRHLPPVAAGRCLLGPGSGGLRGPPDRRRVHHLPLAGGQQGGHDRARCPGRLRVVGGRPGYRPDRDRQPGHAGQLARPGPGRARQLRPPAERRGDDRAARPGDRPGAGRGGGQVPLAVGILILLVIAGEPPSPWPSRC